MKMKIFYVLHIKESVLADCVDAIRFIGNPTEKQRAHLTVRGPYQKRIDVTAMSRKIVGDTVSIDRVGNFFDSGQNTVFFHCNASELKNVWNKPHYPFNPHITLYDGGSREFAHKLYEVINRYTYCLKFQADQLEPISSMKGQESMSLAFAFNSKFVRQALGEKIGPRTVLEFTEERRLQLINRLCQHLAALPGGAQASTKPFQHRLPL
ncbi:MAG: hypothetical protein ACXVCH_10830 [Bdellovibrionota bacterium]